MTTQLFYKLRKIIQQLDICNEHHYTAKMLPLRRDMETLLTFVRDNKVVGTQSTGNMPLKAVRNVTACFVKPPELEDSIGTHIYKVRSETDLWQLYFLHILAEVGGLVTIAPARRWRITTKGGKFLDADPLLQLSFLLTIWWYKVNWLVAYSYKGMGDNLPQFFNLFTLVSLCDLPVETRISFEQFADDLIEKSGLTWTSQVPGFASTALRGSVARMIIHVLAEFGMIEREYSEEPLGKGTASMLVSFKITQFARVLLKILADNQGT